MAQIDDLLAGGDDEVDEEYVRQQRERAARRAVERPMKPPPPPRVQTESAKNTAKGPKTPGTQDRAIAVRLCKAQSTVRYPKDHEDPVLRGQPILNADGARQWKPCERPPMRGQEVCQKHGGMAPQAQQAAKLRLLQATEPLIAALLRIGLNETLTPADRTRAINSALDRTGFRAGVDLNVEEPLFMQMLRREFGCGEDDGPDRTVIEAEVVEREPVDIAELRAAMGQQPEKYEPDPRDRPNYVNGDEALPQAWQAALRPKQGRSGRR